MTPKHVYILMLMKRHATDGHFKNKMAAIYVQWRDNRNCMYFCNCRASVPGTSRWSDSPLVRRSIGPKTHWSDGPLVRKPIGPKTHWSEKVSLVRKPLVRKSVPLVRKPIGPKKCHWSENSGNVDYQVLSKPDTFIGGKLAFYYQ